MLDFAACAKTTTTTTRKLDTSMWTAKHRKSLKKHYIPFNERNKIYNAATRLGGLHFYLIWFRIFQSKTRAKTHGPQCKKRRKKKKKNVPSLGNFDG